MAEAGCIITVLDVYWIGGDVAMLDCEARWREPGFDEDSVLSIQLPAIPPLADAQLGDRIEMNLRHDGH